MYTPWFKNLRLGLDSVSYEVEVKLESIIIIFLFDYMKDITNYEILFC